MRLSSSFFLASFFKNLSYWDKVFSPKALQSLNALFLIEVTLLGMFISFILRQEKNALSSMVVILSGSFTSFKALHPQNVSFLIFSNLSHCDRSIFSKASQSLNALSPMAVTLLGMLISFKL